MSSEDNNPNDVSPPTEPSRRGVVGGACTVAMGGALVGGYGTFAAFCGRYLYPARPVQKGWMFVTQVTAMKNGDAMTYVTPSGAPVAIARQGDTGEVTDFIALSSSCPHLGCKVHWEGQNNRFFCPCHNGVFDPKGQPVSGPPADANQTLPQYKLMIENNLLYIEVDLESLSTADASQLADTPAGENDGSEPTTHDHRGTSNA